MIFNQRKNPRPPYFFISVVFLAILFTAKLRAQTYRHPYRWQTDTLITVPSAAFVFNPPPTHRIQFQSLRAFKNGQRLQKESDYIFENRQQIRFFSLQRGDTLRILYRRLPFNLKSSYSLYAAENIADTSALDSIPRVKIRRVKFENPFENMRSGLQTSGSIMRGVQIGTNRDFSLNSGLNVELSGKLTKDMEVIAALTDEATPIQPEGNTQTLHEVDKIFVNFKSPYVQGTVGDFNLLYKNSDFGKVSRKLQGLTLTGRYKQQQLNTVIATTRGFFNHLTFLGQEGKQGPYQLTGKNGERDIIVLAGTERIWINGKKMVRGESNDYIIEYGNGQIRFTSRRLITSESRIEVDFEYYPAVQKYNRNVYSAVASSGWYGNKLNFRFQAYRETDDPRQVLDEGSGVNAAEKAILRSAGDDPLQAFVPGETYLPDSSGSYLKRDTLWQNETYSYFLYKGKNAGDYSVIFSDVGEGNGAYSRDRLGVYRWVGPKAGRYLPVRLLALPSRHDLADMRIGWKTGAASSLSLEYALSRFDHNILSSRDDKDNAGSALQIKAALDKADIKIRSLNIGRFTMQAQARYIENTFQAADRFRQADFQRFWNIPGEEQKNQQEKSYQAKMIWQPLGGLRFSGNAGRLQRIGFSSKRFEGNAAYERPSGNIILGYVSIGSRSDALQAVNNWKRWSLTANHVLWKWDPQFTFKAEQRRNNRQGLISGFEFKDFGTKLNLYQWKYAQGYYQFNRRFDSVYDYKRADKLLPQSVTTTQRFSLKLIHFKSTSADVQLVRRQKDFSAEFENIKVDTLKLLYTDASIQDTVWQDRTTDLAEINVAHSAYKKAITASMQYRISSEQTALKEKIYFKAGEGRGNLRFDEDLQEYVPDADGEYLLFILPSGKFEPVTTVQAAARIKLDPARYRKKPKGMLSKILNTISSETYFRVEEETKAEDLLPVYLLDLSQFQGANTVHGTTQLNQDFHILRRNRKLSFRVRYRYRSSASSQFLVSGENETRQSGETGLRASWRLNNRLKGQTEVRNRTILRSSAANPLRSRDIMGWYLQQNFSWRPHSRWEIGLESEAGSEDNRSLSYPIKLQFGLFKSRLNYSLPGKGRASAHYQLQTVQVIKNPFERSVPYEMAHGKKEGISQNWQARFEYTLAKNIVFSIFYSGRNEAGFERVIHSGQAEIRAFF